MTYPTYKQHVGKTRMINEMNRQESILNKKICTYCYEEEPDFFRLGEPVCRTCLLEECREMDLTFEEYCNKIKVENL